MMIIFRSMFGILIFVGSIGNLVSGQPFDERCVINTAKFVDQTVYWNADGRREIRNDQPSKVSADDVPENRLKELRAFALEQPQHACISAVYAVLDSREAKIQALKKVLAPGPQRPRLVAYSLNGIEEFYPQDALRNGWGGRVGVELYIEEDGQVEECSISQSSGYTVLDEAACAMFLKKALYEPARDARSRPIATRFATSLNWVIPD